MNRRITLIAAMDRNNGIGINNTLPWKISEDMQWFKRHTTSHTVIMGRKTWESLGRALPNRYNIVLSKSNASAHGTALWCSSIEEAIDNAPSEEIFIIGGAEIYKQTLPLADRLLITQIDDDYKCDAFFPEIPVEDWVAYDVEQSKEPDAKHKFYTYLRAT